MTDFSKQLLDANSTVLDAFSKLNDIPENLTLFIVDKNQKLLGTLTDGDIRRGFLKGLQLADKVSSFMTKKFHFIRNADLTQSQIREIKKKGIRLLPVVNDKNQIIRIVDFSKVKTILPLDVVFMAGGRGERLRPLTDKVPKPMLKIGEKPILEINLEHTTKFGIRNYFICVKYLHEIIEEYFGSGEQKWGSLQYIIEDEPLGTIGAITKIKEFKHEDILLMNADLFTDINIDIFYENFKRENADMSIASIPYRVDVPYAVFDLEKDQIKGFKEKPTYTYYSNAGIYLFKKEIIKYIPDNKFFNATDLIEVLVNKKLKVTRFPILGYWIDIGKPEDFNKVQEMMKFKLL
ncbi:MAG: nucleotidyltransferase [Bacteroidetes bacterium HGW-Bacteroidetes-19]|nr:MAG: nucleotidyltransferase [Bacteroidetes bacterium HGW-Bacteroidetes-19]